MPVNVVLGAQWGDEGKGKVVDALAEDADVIVRFNGGANAGHTIVIKDKIYPIHLLPSGIFRPGKVNLVGPGVAFDPEVGVKEIELASNFGSKIVLDESTPVVLPIHRLIDGLREQAAGASALGTTKRGIGPLYSDFWLRRGVTLGDFRSKETIVKALGYGGYWRELVSIVSELDDNDDSDLDSLSLNGAANWCMSFADVIVPLLGDTRHIVHSYLSEGKNVLFEGAQGIMLDAYFGQRPYCTSSLCTAAGVSATFGVYRFDRVIGVAKAYATRVGAGPFPTELFDEKGEELRRLGNEYGTTTGRPRRCGWLDLFALSYACVVGGITELVITKMDVLSGMSGVCLGINYEGENSVFTLTRTIMEKAKVSYHTRPVLIQDFSNVKSFHDLDDTTLDYIHWIRHWTGVPVSGIGIGPERDQLIWLNK